ncbi:MYXO-CTERM sorting domain-containing protein [Nannocystis sp.]|uniref:MYXO-CTERM sorting domain-containing protein n=1 Tax=Nannocystis sp. TaxID=1962667 RepID=UPI00344C7137
MAEAGQPLQLRLLGRLLRPRLQPQGRLGHGRHRDGADQVPRPPDLRVGRQIRGEQDRLRADARVRRHLLDRARRLQPGLQARRGDGPERERDAEEDPARDRRDPGRLGRPDLPQLREAPRHRLPRHRSHPRPLPRQQVAADAARLPGRREGSGRPPLPRVVGGRPPARSQHDPRQDLAPRPVVRRVPVARPLRGARRRRAVLPPVCHRRRRQQGVHEGRGDQHHRRLRDRERLAERHRDRHRHRHRHRHQRHRLRRHRHRLRHRLRLDVGLQHRHPGDHLRHRADRKRQRLRLGDGLGHRPHRDQLGQRHGHPGTASATATATESDTIESADQLDDDGCGCDADSSPAGALGSLALLGLLGIRRRRKA